MSKAGAYLALARPAHWIKNGFVLVGLLFGHGWRDPLLLAAAIACFAGFCLVSSAVYVFNDVMDREADRAHPLKRDRPLASGAIGVAAALVYAAALASAGLALCALASTTAVALVLAYIGLNLGYSLGLKHVVVLDVFIIAAGFMLRILVGTLGVGIEPSRWLLLCGFTLTLFLGFAKRRSELSALQSPATIAPENSASGNAPDRGLPVEMPTRRVLATYSLRWLDGIIGVCAVCTVAAYALYTLDERTLVLHGTNRLVVTVPVVIYGIGRYLWTLHRLGGGGDPATQFWRDPHLLGSFICWLGLTGWLIS